MILEEAWKYIASEEFLLILLVLNLFKQPLATLLPQAWKDWHQNRVNTRTGKLNSELLEIIKDKEEFERTFYTTLTDALQRNTDAISSMEKAMLKLEYALRGIKNEPNSN